MYLTMNRKKSRKKTSENKNELTNKEIIKEELTKEEEDIVQCLICWETRTDENEIYKMKHIELFESNCSCDCNFHLICFYDWVKKTPTCPICREELYFNEELYYIHYLGPHYKIKLFFKKVYTSLIYCIKVLLKCAATLFLLQVCINIISGVLYKFERGI